jgi:hypothetical protein
MFALRRHYVREADEGAASSASLPEIPEKRPIRFRDNDEIDESSASLPENGIKSRQQPPRPRSLKTDKETYLYQFSAALVVKLPFTSSLSS